MFALKQLVASARSSSVALLGRAPAATKWRTTERLYNVGADCLEVGDPALKSKAYSFYVTKPGQWSHETLHYPANVRKIKETAESLCLFIEMGPLIPGELKEFLSLRASYDKQVNKLSIAALFYGGRIDRSYSANLFLPDDCDVYKKLEMESVDGGVMLTIGKRLDASLSVAASVFRGIWRFFNPRRAWSVVNNYFADRYYPMMAARLLQFVPHTFCYTTRVKGKRELLEKVSLGEGTKMVIDIPGIEKTSYTADGAIQVHLDLKLLDFGNHLVQYRSLVSEDRSVIIITGFGQREDIRRNFTARVDFPKLNAEDYQLDKPKKEIKDGAIIITIPRSQNRTD